MFLPPLDELSDDESEEEDTTTTEKPVDLHFDFLKATNQRDDITEFNEITKLLKNVTRRYNGKNYGVIAVSSCDQYVPKIDDFFKTLTEDRQISRRLANPPDVITKNLTIDVEKVNVTVLMAKLKSLTKNVENNTAEDYNARRLAYVGRLYQWNNASIVLVKNKLFDLMLQLIYMARHKIKQLENEPYYNPSDTSYRIAFLYRRLRRLRKKLLDIYTTMVRNRHNKANVFDRVNPFLILHHKAAKLHVDFLYLWWLLVKLHEKYDFRHGIPNTTPID
ncbi:uncharacterized protein LOC124536398 [Vanessa cardui]|uniref:uncharacterized protein LOC124536398 n=1 Tax=Vanessa cardui TaxID=171605 RepID=UPI001F13AC44|nr:uncharacterized protein LOC124536398 [Vanessa cardui]